MDSFPIEKIISSFEKKLKAEEQQLLEAWLNESEQNRKKYGELKKIYFSSEKLNIDFNPNPTQALKQLNKKLSFRSSIRTLQRIAAVLIIGVISTLFYLQISTNQQLQQFTADNRMAIYLPDSTKVILDKNTTIGYPKKFSRKKRNINIEGNAYFEVRHNKQAPFTVSAPNTQITVLGTKFLVRANENEESVTVDEGRVAFKTSGKQISEPLILTKQQSGTWKAGDQSLKKLQIDDTNANAWLSGRLIFNNTPLKKVVNDISKFYNISVQLETNHPLPLRYTGSFNKTKPEEALEIICLTLDLKFEKSGSNYIIKL